MDPITPQSTQGMDPQQLKSKDLVVRQAMTHIIGGQGQNADAIITKAQAGDPKEAVLDAIAPLLQSIYDSAQKAGAQVDMLTMMVAGIEVIGNVAEMLASAKLIPGDEKSIATFAAEVAKAAVLEHNQRVQGGGEMPPAAPGAPQPMSGMLNAGG